MSGRERFWWVLAVLFFGGGGLALLAMAITQRETVGWQSSAGMVAAAVWSLVRLVRVLRWKPSRFRAKPTSAPGSPNAG